MKLHKGVTARKPGFSHWQGSMKATQEKSRRPVAPAGSMSSSLPIRGHFPCLETFSAVAVMCGGRGAELLACGRPRPEMLLNAPEAHRTAHTAKGFLAQMPIMPRLKKTTT